jgi:FkbM family methyltransferase
MENAYTIGQRKQLKTNPIIIDIGANVGFFTMFALSKFPNCTIYSYEPIYSNFRQLIKNRDMNSSKKVYCFNKAVCGHSGKINIYFNPTDSFTTAATVITSEDKDIKSIEVPCLSLSEIFEKNKIEDCDLLKLDCEGAEYEILYNSPEETILKINQLAIEVHQGNNENENILSLKNFLEESNFKLFQLKNKPHMLWAYRL